MNDDEMLASMRTSATGITDSMTDVRLELPVSAIHARARGRRVRRGLAGASVGGLALGISVAVAVSGGPVSGGSAGPGARAVHVNLDAWSVNTLSSGLVYVNVRELQDPGLLRKTLADAGIPAIVTFGEICAQPNSGGYEDLARVIGKTASGDGAKLTIDPAGIPRGSELSIGIMSASKRGFPGLNAAFTMVQKGARLTCIKPGTIRNGAGKKGQKIAVGSGTVGSGTAENGTVKSGSGS